MRRSEFPLVDKIRDEAYQKGRADAIGEYAERLHSAISNRGCADIHDVISDVAEEMKEKKNETD